MIGKEKDTGLSFSSHVSSTVKINAKTMISKFLNSLPYPFYRKISSTGKDVRFVTVCVERGMNNKRKKNIERKLKNIVWRKRNCRSFSIYLFFLASSLLLDVGEGALTAVRAVVVNAHEDTSTAVGVGALLAGASDLVFFGFTVTLNLVELEDAEADVLVLVALLDLLALDHLLLLLLLFTTAETEDKVKSGLLLDVVVLKSAAFFELLAGEDQTLLIRRDALLILDLGLHVIDCVVRFDLKGNVLACESADENLHFSWGFLSFFFFFETKIERALGFIFQKQFQSSFSIVQSILVLQQHFQLQSRSEKGK